LWKKSLIIFKNFKFVNNFANFSFLQPFKKASKSVSKKFDRAVSDVTYLMRDAVTDIDRKFNDFFNMTMEMFEHQHHQLENYETSLNGLRQCCSGTTSDLSDFKARSVASLDRLDVFLARNMNDQNVERCRQQIRFDADRIMAAVKDQEKLLLENADRCSVNVQPNKNETFSARESTDVNTTTTTKATTDSTTTTTTVSTTTTIVTPTTERPEEASRLIMRTCEDLMNAGFLESKVYTLDIEDIGNNENGRDFRRRFCDQDTSGGGWTVPGNSIRLIAALVIVHRLLSWSMFVTSLPL
jgi:hypothetical protein